MTLPSVPSLTDPATIEDMVHRAAQLVDEAKSETDEREAEGLRLLVLVGGSIAINLARIANRLPAAPFVNGD